MILDLPDIRQRTGWDCGRAAVDCVVQFVFGERADLRKLMTTPMDGTDPRNIESMLRMLGCDVLSGEMDVTDLKYHISRNRPVIAAVKNHYVVVKGVGRGRVHYQDPTQGPVKATIDDFVGWWKETDRLGVVYRCFGIAASVAGG